MEDSKVVILTANETLILLTDREVSEFMEKHKRILGLLDKFEEDANAATPNKE